jgi:hypothetical protein
MAVAIRPLSSKSFCLCGVLNSSILRLCAVFIESLSQVWMLTSLAVKDGENALRYGACSNSIGSS